MIRFLLFFLFFIPGILIAQPDDFITIQKTGHTNYSLVYSQYYDGKSLWGYMDGGADLYLEYGFEGLLVQEINYKGSTIKCEIYKMKDALSAFGIFSVQRHNCKLNSTIDVHHCINNYQVQLVRGDYYFSLINQAGDSTTQNTSVEVATWFINSIEKKEIAFPEYPYFNSKSHNLIYLAGKISMGNVYPQAMNYLEDISDFNVWLLPADSKKAPVISIIELANEENINKYATAAFPGITFNKTAERKLKKGGVLLSRKMTKNNVLQIEGKAGKDLRKILGFE